MTSARARDGLDDAFSVKSSVLKAARVDMRLPGAVVSPYRPGREMAGDAADNTKRLLCGEL